MPIFRKYYRPQVSTAQLAALSRRSNTEGSLRVGLHLGSLVITGLLFLRFSETGLWAPATVTLLLHGTIFTFLGYAGAAHEFSHGSVFKQRLLNEAFFHLFSFLTWSNAGYFRRTHGLHHTNTLVSGIDIEVIPVDCASTTTSWLNSIFNFGRLLRTLRIQIANARGIVPSKDSGRLFPRDSDRARRSLIRAARVLLIGHFALTACFAISGYWQLIILVNLASFISNGPVAMLASVQHCSMKSDSLDFRENSRTILLNPVISFFYWNMNYHLEHHLFPGIPCYHLPKLRQLIEHELPPPAVGVRGVLELLQKAPVS